MAGMSSTTDNDDPAAGYGPFAHLATPNAALYRQVMEAFLAAKRRFTVHLRPEDVHAALPSEQRPALEAVGGALESLERWGNLRADPDTSRVTAVEDFYRRRLIYQLTREGEAVEEALAAYDEALGRRGELQAVALADIATQLRALIALADEGDPDPAVAHLTLLGLVDRFTGLADNASAFMGSLQRTIDLHDAQVEAFLAYKDRLIDYLKRFIEDLVTRGAEIAGLLGELAEDGRTDLLLRVVSARDAADAAPDQSERAAADAYARWRERFDGLRSWFLSAPGRDAQAKLLRSAARHAIPDLLGVVRALNERRSGRSDRSADFRALALWFAQAPDDEARHRLWRSAFGLYGARHLTVDPGTLEAWDADPVPASVSWEDAPSLRISAQLRRTGAYERRGKARAVQDRGEAKRHLAELARKQAEQTAAARARLSTRGEVRLSDLGQLDTEAFRLFLQLLGDALARLRPGAERLVATTNDGTMEIRMTRVPQARTVEIRTADGVLSGPEHMVEIIDLAAWDQDPDSSDARIAHQAEGRAA